MRSPRQRRQRTTSINLQTTIDATESIIRSNNRTIYTAGRPPWYNCAGQQVEPFVIGLFLFFGSHIQNRKKNILHSLSLFQSQSHTHNAYANNRLKSIFCILHFVYDRRY